MNSVSSCGSLPAGDWTGRSFRRNLVRRSFPRVDVNLERSEGFFESTCGRRPSFHPERKADEGSPPSVGGRRRQALKRMFWRHLGVTDSGMTVSAFGSSISSSPSAGATRRLRTVSGTGAGRRKFGDAPALPNVDEFR